MGTPLQQLQAMRNLAENWDGYGAAAPNEHVLELAQEFVGLIEDLLRNAAVESLGIQVCPSRVGGVLIEWENRLIEHEVEINPDGSIGFLYRNKSTGEIQTRKLAPEAHTVIHPGFLHELRQLLAA